MATKTFTNEQLAKQWVKAAKSEPKGTRRDVVLGIMGEIGVEDKPENYRKVYNNVTQRVKQLEEGQTPITFPALAEGKKGARRSGAEVAALTAILAEAVAPATEGEKAPEQATA
jgi:hypothetical protein